MNIFEFAAKNKLRIEDNNGRIFAVEDLFDLPLVSRTRSNLDDLYRKYNKAIKEYGEESYVTKSEVPEETVVTLELIKHVIDVKNDEKNKAEETLRKREQQRKLDELIARKRDSQLEELSLEELIAMRESA